MTAAISATTGTVSGAMAGAVAAVRAANTFSAVFLCFYNIRCRQGQDQYDHGHNNYINRIHKSILSAKCILRLDLPIGSNAQVNDNTHNDRYRNQSSQETGTNIAGGDQCTDLINYKTEGIASG